MTTATPIWSINTLDRSLPDGTVTTIHWTVSLTEDDGLSASAYGTIGLSKPDSNAFTPYDELNHDVVLGWLHEALGEEQVAAYEQSLINQLNEKKYPTHATGLPWS